MILQPTNYINIYHINVYYINIYYINIYYINIYYINIYYTTMIFAHFDNNIFIYKFVYVSFSS